ncbi:hypothetical protein AB0H06_22110 [Streptomyces althioticus]|uniref:hypothetical protein n=1 Tax=Streptomyces althioticus TaxID=83380 RepID=UPI0033F983AC
MSVVSVSAALLMKVALEARGSGSVLWQKLESLVAGTGGSAALTGPYTRELSNLEHAPSDVEAAQLLSTGLAERAQRDEGFRAALEAWVDQAAGHLVYETRGCVPVGILTMSVLRDRHSVEAHYSISGGTEDELSQPSGAFAPC